MKHVTTANKDDKLISIRAEFGMWGIGVYWTLVELTAEKISEKTETAEAMLIVSELLGLFGCKRNKLETFLKHSANVLLFKYELNGNILKIDIPKLLDYADNYIKYDGKSLKSLQRQSKMSLKQDIDKDIEEDIDKDIDKDKSTDHVENYQFENIWIQYPNRQGKKNASRHFIATIKNQNDYENICKAMKNYLDSANVKKGFIKNGSTWFNEWQDWIEPTEIMMKGNSNGTNSKPIDKNSAIARANFRHGETEMQHLRELNETLKERDRVRGLRSQSDSEQGS